MQNLSTDAAREFAAKLPEGESVTLSGNGKSVTLIGKKPKEQTELDAEIAKVKDEWWFNYPAPGDSFGRALHSITC